MEIIQPNEKVNLNEVFASISPEGFRIVTEADYQQLQKLKHPKPQPEFWTLKEFAWNVWHQQGVKRAASFLFRHRDDLDMANGGFIDYEHTHNGWKIPSVEMKKYIISLKGSE